MEGGRLAARATPGDARRVGLGCLEAFDASVPLRYLHRGRAAAALLILPPFFLLFLLLYLSPSRYLVAGPFLPPSLSSFLLPPFPVFFFLFNCYSVRKNEPPSIYSTNIYIYYIEKPHLLAPEQNTSSLYMQTL